jgi:putative tryptophan/tyrosine transport system substrate-binding protein
MRRRSLLSAAAATLLPLAARARDAGPMRRVAVLVALSESDPEGQSRFAGLSQGLHDLGWIEGKNIRIDVRYAGSSIERMREVASEFVAAAPDVIVVNGTPALGEIYKATRTIPVVFMSAVDPVKLGYIDSLARPGHNITGFGSFDLALIGKWLQLLKDIAPSISHATLLHNPANTPYYPQLIKSAESLSGLPAVALRTAAVQEPSDIDRVIGEIARQPDGGLFVPPDVFNTRYRNEIAESALRLRLPLVSNYPSFARAGALLSYGSASADTYRRAATYVDRILKGAKPSELPVQLPTTYVLVINMVTARKLGLVVPQTLLAAADEVID